MSRARVAAFVALALVPCTSSAQGVPVNGSRPNVVLIITDDVGSGDIGSSSSARAGSA